MGTVTARTAADEAAHTAASHVRSQADEALHRAIARPADRAQPLPTETAARRRAMQLRNL
ncbi:hypothetical protein QMK19_03515 [Streptomyces sp. H10-C2]|uniref:hypothetical protein n=1 Tax=unclassified Streptomyces TaxID=2593676 RepID=UPI0024B8E026|nr:MULTISPECIES: hypothetical protein [unclassified Streptomyces]MDJ0342255.1 hypothetical protein [Streptomyces sp. PH10-H1]MDJ0368769.1 hypothetical protein [Streptomyces sp. H10-C2]